MEEVPHDIIKIILEILPITGKRNLIRCNKNFNKLNKTMEKYENVFTI